MNSKLWRAKASDALYTTKNSFFFNYFRIMGKSFCLNVLILGKFSFTLLKNFSLLVC